MIKPNYGVIKVYYGLIRDITRATCVRAENGTQLPARTIFAHTLRYFREHAVRELTDATGAKVVPEDIR